MAFRAALRSPLSVLRLPARTWRWIGLYVLAGCAVVAGALAVWHASEPHLEEALSSYLFPDSWRSVFRWVAAQLIGGQTGPLVVSALVTTSGLVASLLLFPLKARISATYEDARRLVDETPRELPRAVEVWDEVKLALAFVAVQASLVWLGYFEVAALKLTATVLSYLVLFAIFAVNFVAPLFQRHGGYYSQTAKVLLRHPVTALVFGAMFAAPVVAAGLVWRAYPGWDRTFAIALLSLVTLLTTAWAQAAGTEVAAALFGRFRATRRTAWPGRAAAWLFFGALLAGNGYLFGSVALSVHHKSQILKCDYGVDLAGARLERPTLGELMDGKVTLGVSVPVRIENPTPFDLEVEENRVEVRHGETLVATTRVSPFRVPAGARHVQRLSFRATVEAGFVTKGLALFESGWTITLYLEVARGFELPVYLLK